jgi:hypothetical protein
MKSRPIENNQNVLASHHNDRRDDARGGSFLLAHQQLGTLALGTEPTNGQVVPIVINGTTITVTAVTSIGSTANNVLIGGSALAFTTNLINFLRRPDLTTSTQVAASAGNQLLLEYVGWAWPGSSTNIVPFSLNKNVNGLTGPLTSFNITGITVTSATWTAQTMQLYVEDGTYFVGTTRVLFTGGSTPTVTAPSSHPRIDVLAADSSGTLAWTTGTENASPVAPTYPTGKVVICELYNVVGETALYENENQQTSQGYIYNDVRPLLGGTYISTASQIASGVVIFDPGSDAQGDILYYNGSAWVLLTPGTAGYALTTGGAGANPSYQPLTVTHTNGIGTRSTTGSQTIAHGLGRTPANIKMYGGFSTGTVWSFCSGEYNGTQAVYQMFSSGSGTSQLQNTGYILLFYSATANGQFYASITVDATNIYLTWATNNTAYAVDFVWDAS